MKIRLGELIKLPEKVNKRDRFDKEMPLSYHSWNKAIDKISNIEVEVDKAELMLLMDKLSINDFLANKEIDIIANNINSIIKTVTK